MKIREFIDGSSAKWLHNRHFVLDSKDQPALRWLNSSEHMRLCVLVPFGSSPFCLVKAERGLFGMNRETASCHTVCRKMGGPASAGATARAREDRKTHRPTDRENDSSLNLTELPKQNRGLAATAKIGESETGINNTPSLRLSELSQRLPGAGGCNSPLISKKPSVDQLSGWSGGKTGYVLAQNSRQVPSPTVLVNYGFLFLFLFMSTVRIWYSGFALLLFGGLFLFVSVFCFLLVRSLVEPVKA